MHAPAHFRIDDTAELAAFIEMHLARHAEVLIIDPNRSNRSAFTRAMGQRGFDVAEAQIDLPLADGSPYRGRLLHYQR